MIAAMATKATTQQLACPRCRRRFQASVRDSVIEALRGIGWRLSPDDELVCPHCADKPVCTGSPHLFEVVVIPWLGLEFGGHLQCRTCGQVALEQPGSSRA